MMGQAVNVYCKCRSSVRNYNLRQNNLIQSTSAWRHPRAVLTGSEVVMESLNMFSAFGSWRSWLLNHYLLLSLFVTVIIKKKNQKPEKLSFSSHPGRQQTDQHWRQQTHKFTRETPAAANVSMSRFCKSKLSIKTLHGVHIWRVYQAPPPLCNKVKLEDLRWWKNMNESEIW